MADTPAAKTRKLILETIAEMKARIGDEGTNRAVSTLTMAHNMISDLEAELRTLRADKERLEEQKDGAYSERDKLVCALSKLLLSWLERHPEEDAEWEDDWRWIVVVNAVGSQRQMTWHIHDSELEWFDHLDRMGGHSWDGHTTEEKYERLATIDTAAKGET